MILNSTEIMVFNENGIMTPKELDSFFEKIKKIVIDNDHFSLDDESSEHIFKTLLMPSFRFTIYNEYVMKIEGEVYKAIYLIREIDRFLDKKKAIYISASERIVNDDKCKFKRGKESLIDIAEYLDNQFANHDYTNAIANRN